MSFQSDVAHILRDHPVDRIRFKVENIAIDGTQMDLVAKAIDKQDIAVAVGSSGPQLGAAYSSFVGRTFGPGEKKLIGSITLGSENVVRSALGRAAIYHESVHALKDVKGWKVPSMQDEEVVAYLADAMYLRANHTSVSGGALEMAIYKAAFAIVDARNMLTRPGVVLNWGDCDALRSAIKAHPAYR
ncbi:MAG TPA: hypothetical protein VL484_11020 [Vicinamibacterales bacterium]|jgi:hypothetical protein|nr:hypothetical protein [Vicinamibacterales bacterium]